MIRIFIRKRIRKHREREGEIREEDIENAKAILFSVFTRYGDSVIAFKVIKEFCEKFPSKHYILLTSHQSLPYAKRILLDKAEFHSINRRRNPFRFFRLQKKFRNANIDIAFNPCSYGDDSEFFLTFARKFQSNRSLSKKYGHEYNLYDRAREYLKLLEKRINLSPLIPEHVRQILIIPFATDIRKSLDRNDLSHLIKQIGERFRNYEITIGLYRHMAKMTNGLPCKRFLFVKSFRKSEKFMRLLEASDLVISVDSGPLHLADALRVRAIGIFGPTAPETILDRDSTIVPLRTKQLKGVFCYVKSCTNPQCMHDLFKDNFFVHSVCVDFYTSPVLEDKTCRIRSANLI